MTTLLAAIELSLKMKDGQVEVGGFVVKAELNEGNSPMLRVAGNGAKLVVENGNLPMLSGTKNGDSITEVAPYLPLGHLNFLPAPRREEDTQNR
jgi:hypothetical protein